MQENNPLQNTFELDNRRLLVFGLSLLIILSLIVVASLYVSRGKRIGDQTPLVDRSQEIFAPITVQAKSALVWDIKNQKVLFEKNPDEKLPLASLAKVMVALTAIDLIPDYTVVTVKKEFLNEEGDSGLFADERWKLSDLIDFSLVVSSNDAATAIAAVSGYSQVGGDTYNIGRELFLTKMNERAGELGLTQTVFSKENGLDTDKENGGAYGSARDIVRLFEYVLKNHPEIFEATKYKEITITSLNNIHHVATNTNQIVDSIPGLVASKTGYTELSGGNLAIVLDPGIGRPVVIAVLGSTLEGRFEDVNLLSQKVLEYLASESTQ
jgi:D-alanyl-D-alanine carboxypeptidase (penicillin-binding protein 5/6)